MRIEEQDFGSCEMQSELPMAAWQVQHESLDKWTVSAASAASGCLARWNVIAEGVSSQYLGEGKICQLFSTNNQS